MNLCNSVYFPIDIAKIAEGTIGSTLKTQTMRLQGTFSKYAQFRCISYPHLSLQFLCRSYVTLTLAATCVFQMWHAYGTQMFGRHLLPLLNLAMLLPVKRWILPLERARSFFWAVACSKAGKEFIMLVSKVDGGMVPGIGSVPNSHLSLDL